MCFKQGSVLQIYTDVNRYFNDNGEASTTRPKVNYSFNLFIENIHIIYFVKKRNALKNILQLKH